jgi:hypothetical protein
MDEDKNLIEKTIDNVKHIAQVASDAAKYAIDSEPLKHGDEVVTMPMATDGMVGMLLLIPDPETPKKRIPDTSGRITPTYDFPAPTSKMPLKKAAKKKQPKSKNVAKKKAAKKSSKKRAARTWKSPARSTKKKTVKKTGKKAVKKKKAKNAKR